MKTIEISLLTTDEMNWISIVKINNVELFRSDFPSAYSYCAFELANEWIKNNIQKEEIK